MGSRLLGRNVLRRVAPLTARRQLLSTSARTSLGAPTEDDVFRSGRPTPEQEAQMKLEMSGEGVPKAQRISSPLDVHTVEDIHHLTAEEALAETGTRRDATLRHFTGKHAARFSGALCDTELRLK